MTTKERKDILISFVMCGRNDDYLGNFKYRITTALNYFARNAEKIGQLERVEIVVVDWNSEQEPLSKALALNAPARIITNFVIVPPEIAKRYHKYPGENINPHIALNAGIRRAEGRYVFLIPADGLISSFSLHNLFHALENKSSLVFDPQKSFLTISRKLIPWQFFKSQPSIEEVERFLQLHSRYLSVDKYFYWLCGGYGAIGLSKILWERLRGLDESLGGWGWSDLELGLRSNLEIPSVDLSFFGVEVFDIQSPKFVRNDQKIFTGIPVSANIEKNHETWGLSKESITNDKVNKTSTQGSVESRYGNLSEDLFQKVVITNFADWQKAFFGVEKDKLNTKDVFALWVIYCCGQLKIIDRSFEFGITDHFPSQTLISVNPGIEIFGIWNSTATKNTDPITSFESNVKKNPFNGYFHIFPGNEKNIFENLQHLFSFKVTFDLVLLHISNCDSPRQKIDFFVDSLNEESFLILNFSESQMFLSTLRHIQTNFSSLIVLPFQKYKTILCIKLPYDKQNLQPPISRFFAEATKIFRKEFKIFFITQSLLKFGKLFYDKVLKRYRPFLPF